MLRQLLLAAKLCDERLIVEAAAQAEADGTSTLMELVRRGSLDCDKLAALLAEKTKLPVLSTTSWPSTKRRSVRCRSTRLGRCWLPLQLDLDARPPRMRFAMANPLDEEARREIEKDQRLSL